MFTVRNLSGFSQPFLYALVFLTRLPVASLLHKVDKETAKKSVYFYPLVGAVIGILLSVAAFLLAPLGGQLQSAILLGFWILMTGALHLDGLADCTDAYFAGHKCENPEERRNRILTVMHDPHCGSVAAVALSVFLLIKFSAIAAVIASTLAQTSATWVFLPLVLAPVLARTAALFLMSITNYARMEGMVPPSNSNRNDGLLPVVVLVAACCVALVPIDVAIGLAIALPALIFFWRHLWQKNIGGYTGDCLGALVEITELAVLIVWVALAAN
ncbi:adenosylcobinamide-GDP ribazoletransferase [uncultured Microbulbifer sp.]|uniref:adenosylcobinamide-GDP ribazoletransferase n=1 Tax=uncultured Microbulbifer sp. TaxID=348147 RepID=UPI00260E7AF2|nr:adenosylcobinamide-GDP ribazoletransferase [uncultured Microbulbifer sp.]